VNSFCVRLPSKRDRDFTGHTGILLPVCFFVMVSALKYLLVLTQTNLPYGGGPVRDEPLMFGAIIVTVPTMILVIKGHQSGSCQSATGEKKKQFENLITPCR
jgi:hypothetical protein